MPYMRATTDSAGSTVKPSMVAKRAPIETEARKLAQTGAHRGWQTIQAALVAQGFEEAPKVIANLWTRSELDRLCERAQHQRPTNVQ